MPFLSKLKNARKAAEEHKKQSQTREADPQPVAVRYRHKPTHAAQDAYTTAPNSCVRSKSVPPRGRERLDDDLRASIGSRYSHQSRASISSNISSSSSWSKLPTRPVHPLEWENQRPRLARSYATHAESGERGPKSPLSRAWESEEVPELTPDVSPEGTPPAGTPDGSEENSTDSGDNRLPLKLSVPRTFNNDNFLQSMHTLQGRGLGEAPRIDPHDQPPLPEDTLGIIAKERKRWSKKKGKMPLRLIDGASTLPNLVEDENY